MGHEDFPLWDTVPLCQGKSDAVDVFLKGPSEVSTKHIEGKEKKQMTPISKEKSSSGHTAMSGRTVYVCVHGS